NVLRTVGLFPEDAGIELSIELAERGFRSVAGEDVADREARRGLDQGRIVGRGDSHRVDDRARDRVWRGRNNSAAELAHNLAAAQGDLRTLGKRQIPDLIVVGVFKR